MASRTSERVAMGRGVAHFPPSSGDEIGTGGGVTPNLRIRDVSCWLIFRAPFTLDGNTSAAANGGRKESGRKGGEPLLFPPLAASP